MRVLIRDNEACHRPPAKTIEEAREWSHKPDWKFACILKNYELESDEWYSCELMYRISFSDGTDAAYDIKISGTTKYFRVTVEDIKNGLAEIDFEDASDVDVRAAFKVPMTGDLDGLIEHHRKITEGD